MFELFKTLYLQHNVSRFTMTQNDLYAIYIDNTDISTNDLWNNTDGIIGDFHITSADISLKHQRFSKALNPSECSCLIIVSYMNAKKKQRNLTHAH